MNPLKLVIGFVPFLAFSVLCAWIPVSWAALVGTIAAIVLVFATLRGGLKILPVAQTVILGAVAVLAFTGSPETQDFLLEYGRGGASIVLGLFILVTAPVLSFTSQYARESAPQSVWRTAAFRSFNSRISAAWGVAVVVVGICRLVSGIAGDALAGVIAIVVNWGIPLLALYLAYRFTQRAITTARTAVASRSTTAAPIQTTQAKGDSPAA